MSRKIGMEPWSRYSAYWNEIRRLAPHAVLLRGPAHLDPVQSVGRDLDIFLPTDRPAVRAFLREQGFWRTYRPEAYVERYQLRLIDDPDSYGVDLYKAYRWGLGFRLTNTTDAALDPRLASVLHAVVDGKGTAYFEKVHNGPPWRQDGKSKVSFSDPLGRTLWRSGNKWLLSVYLLLRGIIRPDLSLILRNTLRRLTFRFWRIKCQLGFEVALLGVDGTGKTSLAQALLELPIPVKVVYMGDKVYTTYVRRLADGLKLPWPLRRLALSYELCLRRLSGWFLTARGRVVIYDRHPAERLHVRPASLRSRIRNLLDRLHARPADLTFWLTGNCVKIYERKKEHPAVRLEAMDRHIQDVLRKYSIPYERIDVSKEDLDTVKRRIAGRILATYWERASIENLQGVLRMILA